MNAMPEESKKPVTDRHFSAVNKKNDERTFFGTRNGVTVELTPVDTYPQTTLRLVSPAGTFEEKLYYSHLGLAKILTEYDFETVLDIGSASGVCARAFRFLGKNLTAIDVFPNHPTDGNADHLAMSLNRQFDLVWCSHALERRRNVGAFLDQVFDALRDDGIAAITVPSALSPLIIGHPNIFTPLHVIYHLVLAGFDCRDARVKSYDWQFTVIVRKRWNGLPRSNVATTHFPLDVRNFHPDLLKFFPVEIPENGHTWGEVEGINWEPRPELAANQLAPVRGARPAARGDSAGTPDPAAPGPAPIAPAGAVDGPRLAILAGTRHARYALPLDYLPSRDLQPRWGKTHPPIAVLSSWFSAHAPQYEAFLEEMARSLPRLASIPVQFSEQRFPEPAWFSVPFAPFDSLALYTMVRLLKPQTYLEIGSGISTCFVAKAVRDHNLQTRIISIDPEPRRPIDAICDEVIRDGLETCELDRFDRLQPGDIVFFDGSHRSFMNSDVTVFMIDILPRLKPGVVVHVHDITLPWDYASMFVNWYWNEQYLLAVYLMAARDRLDPILPTTFVCRDARFADRLANPFIDFGDPHLNSGWRGGGSMWFTHKADVPIAGGPKPEDGGAASEGGDAARRVARQF